MPDRDTAHAKDPQNPGREQRAPRGEGRGRGRGRGSGRGRPEDSPEVALSKLLSYHLRHGAEKAGLAIRRDGYVRVNELLALRKFRGMTLETLQKAVAENDKQRFHILEEPGPVYWIRANRWHTVTNVVVNMEEVVDASSVPVAVHGTTRVAWAEIAKTGLSRVRRQHVFFAQGLPGADGVISVRNSSEILVFLDLAKAMRAGIKFYVLQNGLVVTLGNKHGCVPPEFFLRVEDAQTHESIPGFEGPKDPILDAVPAEPVRQPELPPGTDEDKDAEAA